MKLQVDVGHYFRPSYDTKERFISYWYQIDEIISLRPPTILEVGVGNKLVLDYLKKCGYKITSLDIDEGLNPDYVGTILEMPFPDSSFEVVAAYEVLEHLPYEKFSDALSEIHRVSSEYAVLSLPDATRVYEFYLRVPKMGVFKRLITIPRLNPVEHIFNGEHYWEIGKAGYPLKRILHAIDTAGFKVIKTYQVFENPYHRFFVLGKVKKA